MAFLTTELTQPLARVVLQRTRPLETGFWCEENPRKTQSLGRRFGQIRLVT